MAPRKNPGPAFLHYLLVGPVLIFLVPFFLTLPFLVTHSLHNLDSLLRILVGQCQS